MYALTLFQPWAWAMGCGLKRIENRIWPPPQKLLGERIALHAGKKFDKASNETLWTLLTDDDPKPPPRKEAVHGAVVAVARLVNVVTSEHDAAMVAGEDQRRWFFGPYGWVMADTVQLSEPVPCRGYQRLWRLPGDVWTEVMRRTRK